MATVFLGIGSNINAAENLRMAAALFRAVWPNIVFSSVYETAPREIEDQPVFLNTAATIETDETVEIVHKKTMAIEQALKKAPPFRFGPRTIDIDILLYDDVNIRTDSLTVPHPRMLERHFVLEPLSELMKLDDQQSRALQAAANQHCVITNL
ncbi:MAG TPA: 2-amino-4-hydroxy-6-hydroxymethyldihydropteridine diphosphokinase, partial [Candidatus Peribacteraceae bacterium]|nr:2-amino-4-hydroxy-6-hydroxymethyldihydropteridine diphosphokinase [Candidatus Peribacteraceae bacterium]